MEYNESKVQQGTAKLIMASGFALDIEKLDLNQKLLRFTKLNQLNPAVRTNAMHISLNFDPSDQIDAEKMQQLAQAYMERIGFGDQPYLVYQHNDAAHPHLHIATNLIRSDGKRLPTHDIGRLVSEPARKWIEQEFGLVMAEGRKLGTVNHIRPVIYGERPTKQAIGSVLKAVIGDYRFSSLSELNAILGNFNIRAETGSRDSVMFQKKGLLYTVLDSKGSPVGVPIKASSFPFRPTLANLEKKFEKDITLKKQLRQALKDRVDLVVDANGGWDRKGLKNSLAKQAIDLVVRANGEGRIYGLTYVDHRQKVVFNGSDLGKSYAVGGVMQRLAVSDLPKGSLLTELSRDRGGNRIDLGNPLQSLLLETEGMTATSFTKKRKRKKRKGRNL